MQRLEQYYLLRCVILPIVSVLLCYYCLIGWGEDSLCSQRAKREEGWGGVKEQLFRSLAENDIGESKYFQAPRERDALCRWTENALIEEDHFKDCSANYEPTVLLHYTPKTTIRLEWNEQLHAHESYMTNRSHRDNFALCIEEFKDRVTDGQRAKLLRMWLDRSRQKVC